VPGLTAQNVAITNERGELLSSTENGIGELAAGRLSAEASWNRRKTAHVQAVLDAMLGPGRSTVVVTGLLDFNSRSTKRQEFGKKAGALTSDIENEKLTTEGGAAGGPAGTPANVPGAAAAGQAGRSDYDHKKDQSQNAIDTTVTEETAAGGEPKKISVALAISKDGLQNVGGNEEDARSAIEEQVKAAVGFEEERDVIATTVNRQFADTAEALKKAGVTGASAAAGDPITRMLGPFGVYLKPGLALAGLAAMLFLVRRSLRRRQALLASTDASWLPALEAPPIKIEELMPTLAAPSEAQLAGHQKKQLQERIEELATNRPSEVATQLRGWLATDG
jgi:flagellar M-ring protein FliF